MDLGAPAEVGMTLAIFCWKYHTTNTKTTGSLTLALCLTPATGVRNGKFCRLISYGLAPLQDRRLWNLTDLEFDLPASLNVIFDDVIGFFIYGFLWMFNSNLWPNYAPSQNIRLRNLSDIEFDLSRSLKVKCDSVIGLPIYYAFLLMFNSNIWPNSAPLQDIRLRNLIDLGFDLSRLLKVKCDDVIVLVIHVFLFTYTVFTCLTLTT